MKTQKQAQAQRQQARQTAQGGKMGKNPKQAQEVVLVAQEAAQETAQQVAQGVKMEREEATKTEKITLKELAAAFGLTPKTARRLLRKWRKETKRDEVEPPYSRWEWDPTDPEEARLLEEATIWLETQSQLLKRRKGNQE